MTPDTIRAAQRLRDFIRAHRLGGCAVMSSDLCQCPLCDVDMLVSALARALRGPEPPAQCSGGHEWSRPIRDAVTVGDKCDCGLVTWPERPMPPEPPAPQGDPYRLTVAEAEECKKAVLRGLMEHANAQAQEMVQRDYERLKQQALVINRIVTDAGIGSMPTLILVANSDYSSINMRYGHVAREPQGGEWTLHGREQKWYYTHWMPLPAPPSAPPGEET